MFLIVSLTLKKKWHNYIMKFILVEFIPIILIFLLVSYTPHFIHISNSILGRVMAISIILFYTYIDTTYGLLACAMTILFYQSDIVENMLNQYDYIENFEAKLEFEQSKNITPKEVNPTNKPALSYISQYEDPKIHTNSTSESAKSEFRKIHCDKGHLVNKGQVVRADMTEHVFPETEFQYEKCNICDPTCNFSIIEKQLNTLMTEGFVSKSGRG
jgi:hypothetical protein